MLRNEDGMLNESATGSWAGKQIFHQRRVANVRIDRNKQQSEQMTETRRDEERGCLLGLLHSDSSINTWDSDKDDGFGGDKRFLSSADNGNKQQHKWACRVRVCVSRMSILPQFYGRSVHSWDKRQIHLCLVFNGHWSGYCFSSWGVRILRLLSNVLKSATSFTCYITVPLCLLRGWTTSTLYCNLLLVSSLVFF